MAFPSYVTTREVRGGGEPENVVILRTLSNNREEVLIWDDLIQIDRDRFQAIVDAYGGTYPITSSAGYLNIVFANTITGSDSIDLSLGSGSITLNISGTEFTYTPSATDISFSTLVTELNAVISGSATAVISGNKIIVTNDLAGETNDVEVVRDDLFTFLQSDNEFDFFEEFPGVDDTIDALKLNRLKSTTAYAYFGFARKIISVAPSDIGADSTENILNSAFAQDLRGLRVGKYNIVNELATYRSFNVLSYLSTYGISRRRDYTSFSGSATASLVNGKIRLSTGTTNNSTYRDETVELGRYVPGKSAEVGAALIFPNSGLTGDAVLRVGIFDDANGAFFEIFENENRLVVLRGGVRIEDVEQSNWNVDNADGNPETQREGTHVFDPFNEGYLYGVRFSWYGIGKIQFFVLVPIEGLFDTMSEIVLHEFVPSLLNNQSFIDPTLPVTVEINNGTTATNFDVDIGGRRYDILGEFLPETRTVGDFVYNQAISSGALSPVLAFRRKSDFPSVGRNNTVPLYLKSIFVSSDVDLVVRVFTVARDDVDGNFSTVDAYDAAESGLESNKNLTSFTRASATQLFGPRFYTGGGGGNTVAFDKERGKRIPIIRDEEMIIEVEVVDSANGSAITVEVDFDEEW